MGATLSSRCRTPAEKGTVADDRDVDFRCRAFDCRCHAIDTLYKVKKESESDADNEQWTQILDLIRRYDDEMSDKTLQELESSPDSAKGYGPIFERIERVSNAFDTGLLSYLQAKVDLMEKLGRYLPKQGRSWEEFLEDMNTDCEEENILQNVPAKVDRMEELARYLPKQGQSWEEFLEDMNTDCEEENILQNVPAKVDRMEELARYLPKQGQSWEEFLEDMKTDCEEENILQNVRSSPGLEVLKTFKKLTTMLISAIKGVDEDEDEKKSGVSQSVQKENKIKVFYATNRLWSDGSYTSEPGNCLLYGFQQVSIPGVHKRGKVESPNKSGRGNNSEHFMLEAKSGAWLRSNEFLEQIEREFDSECAQNGHSANDAASSTGGPQNNARQVLLYIHGYTVSYNSALKRAAQLKNDLKFEGLVILFSWPTMGHPMAYLRDRRVSKRSAQRLGELITTILWEVSFSEVHILAHSMGNRALIEALTNPWWKLPSHYEELFHQRGVLKNVILAAADEELGKFEVMLPKMNRPNSVHRPQISVYSSACDWPLFVSGYINWHLRLGNMVSFFGNHSMRGGDHMVDVIDASGVRCNSCLQHSYHAEAPEVLDDIQKLLTEHKRAGDRLVIEPLRHISGQAGQGEWVFHAFVPSWWDQSMFNECIERIQNEALPTLRASNRGLGCMVM